MKNFKNDKELLFWMMRAKEQEIYSLFKSEMTGYGWTHIMPRQRFGSLYVPGRRKDRVLLVAHVDTVWKDSPHLKITYDDELGVFHSDRSYSGLDEKGNPINCGYGIGADDRAGVAALYKLRYLGHSLLLVGQEEDGCVGAFCLSQSPKYRELLKNHQFAVEFDRRGRNDLVFYNVGTEEFSNYCQEMTGYREKEGIGSDIALLCQDFCGVNMSIGYKNEHTCNEMLSLDWWQNTIQVAIKWLSKTNLPKFEL